VNAAALILAAGESRRMGTPKALLPFRGETFLDGLIGKLQRYADPVIVVLGHDAETIRSGVQRDARFVTNTNYAQGMLTSLQCGLRAVDSAHAIFTLVDHPNASDSTIGEVLNAPEAPIVIPRFRGKKGHPVRLHRTVIDELLALPITGKPTDVLYRHVDATQFLDLDDCGIVDDIDDVQAYQDLLARAGSV
jgi:molybdenum cofactor cytidylyltransferase